jgi:hypothetical protein
MSVLEVFFSNETGVDVASGKVLPVLVLPADNLA